MKRLGVGVLLLAAGVTVVPAMAAGKVCDVKTYGAKGDGTTKDTGAIQAAIEDCAKAGGGTVMLRGGSFVSGPVVLKSDITLNVAAGAVLLGSTDHADYGPKTVFKLPGLEPFVSATNAENVTITGGGVIDGQGQTWWAMAHQVKDAGILGNAHPRPMGVVFDHSKHIRMENITVQNSGFWQIVPYYSDDIVIQNVKVMAPQHAPNTDGIDPFSSGHIVIDHVFESVGDDDIAIKSGPINSPGPDDPSHDIKITDCEFERGHGISIGSELSGGAQNIDVERVHLKGTDNGIRVKSNRDRGHDVSHLLFKDITMEDVKNAVIISEYYPKVMPQGEVAAMPVGRLTPHFHDITLENVKATGSQWAGVVIGLPESPVTELTMKNVDISAQRGMTIAYATVTGTNVVVTAVEGQGLTVAPSAKVSFTK